MKLKYLILSALATLICACSPAQQPQEEDSVKVITWKASEISNTSAQLSGRYTGVTTELRDHGFYWGTSESSMTEQAGLNSSTDSAADFFVVLTSLEPGTTYYFKAYVTIMDSASGKYVDVEGAVQSFTTKGGNPDDYPDDDDQGYQGDDTGDDTGDTPGGGHQVSGLQYLGCYEMPAISLKNTDACSGSGSERSGGTKWYNYETTNSNQMVITHTYKYDGKIYRNWTALIDKEKKAPLWDAFVMHSGAYPDKNAGRSNNWKEDPGIPSSWQSCFSSNGYSRGHLVASNYRQTCDDANNQTFYYTNQALQYQTQFNDGVWNSLEQTVKSNAPSGRDTLYVVVGLLYEDNNTISGVPVPSHFYKCLMKCSFNADGTMTAAKGCAYIFTNEAHKGMSYSQGITSIDAIEQRSGFDFYANVPANLQEAAEKTSASVW